MRVTCAGLLLLVLLGACDRPADGEIQTWTAADHDHAEESARVAAGAQASGKAGGMGDRQLIELTWRQQCATCHGAIGHGDGPNGPMVKASDLTRPDWQSSVTDEQLALSIQNGKGRMPKFDLPPTVLAGIVQRIRASKGR
jgi:cytochrome c oxidase cbb3-type subunit 3